LSGGLRGRVGFPRYSHYVAYYITTHSRRDIFDSILMAMASINGREEEMKISIAGREGEIASRMRFEVKVVRRNRFRRFNRRAVELIRRVFEGENLDFIDFVVIIRYMYHSGRRIGRAWSDKYLIRFQIGNITFRVYISSIGGLRRITPREIGRRIYFEIIRNLRRKGLRPQVKRVHEIS